MEIYFGMACNFKILYNTMIAYFTRIRHAYCLFRKKQNCTTNSEVLKLNALSTKILKLLSR